MLHKITKMMAHRPEPRILRRICPVLSSQSWNESIQDTLCKYIEIPNVSPLFDKDVLTNGHQDRAVELLMNWVKAQEVPGLSMRLVTAEKRTPLIFIEIEGEGKTQETILMYGHMDKQPPNDGWMEGTGPYSPTIIDGKLYGRGGADDGYSIFASITAIKALKAQKVPHARIVITIEACEESGSLDLPYYIELLKAEIGSPSLVICLDSGCGNYDQLWLTATLRGMMFGTLTIRVSKEGVHSGSASGIMPSTFRIARMLLDRIEDSATGKILVPELYCDIPENHQRYAREIAEILGQRIVNDFPLLEGVKPMADNYAELLLNRSWRPTLSYTGLDGIPPIAKAGNVLRPETVLGLSFRLPPTVDPAKAAAAVKAILERDPPYGAYVSFDCPKAAKGWKAPELAPWVEGAIHKASQTVFGKPAVIWGEGGSIPFMGMLHNMFPETQFVITGVLGPNSNAHGPNEFLHIKMFHNVTVCMASVVADHFSAKVAGKQ